MVKVILGNILPLRSRKRSVEGILFFLAGRTCEKSGGQKEPPHLGNDGDALILQRRDYELASVIDLSQVTIEKRDALIDLQRTR